MRHWLVKGTMLLWSMLVFQPLAYADEARTESGGGYTIEGIPDAHQIDDNVGYFFLEEPVGSTDQIKVKLVNDSTSDKTLVVKVTNANTNVNGIIDYSGSLPDHPRLETPLTSIVKPQTKEVVVAAQSEVETTLDVKMPEKKQEGVIVGGVEVSEKEPETTAENNLSVRNVYSYTIGIVLTNDRNVQINQSKSVELEHVGAKLDDGKKVV